ncbi:DUF7594 domain-containing protein [Dactylosporangium sp. McL0621]|uniref:CBM96 family carbohydrate-binding protein n=1 Tax=Dactylosporangium sp. McL0621 TaxID=3415678 RepID=UPI003CE6B89D
MHSRKRLATALSVALALPVGALALATPAQAAPPAGSEAAATAQAKSTGKAVPVESARTAYTDTLANPDGSYTFTSGAQPRHGWNGKAWADPDATLHANSDGSLSPAAAASGLRLSGGGTGPLAVFDDRTGHLMSITMPMTLPKPTLDGATATYTNVLTGVDLRVTATVHGGITEVLVVHDAAAAADPALADLRLHTKLTGLKMATDHQTVDAVDTTTGRSVFAAPPPTMWDSARPATLRGHADESAITGDERPATSTGRGPGKAAHITGIPLRTDGGSITLTPPAAALHGADVTYPLYIDPAIAPVASPEAYVQSYHTSTPAYNPGDNLRVGFSDWSDGSGWLPGITRSYLHFGQISAMAGKQITEAHIQLTQTGASCSGSYTLKAATSSDFGSNLTWSNQPGIGGSPTDSITVSGTNGGYQIPATNIATNARDAGWATVSVVLWMSTESDHCAYRKFALNPSLVITYWSTPDQPTALSETNGGQTYPCNTTAPGTLIPAATSNQIVLNYSISSPDTGGDALYGNAWVGVDGGARSPITTSIPYSGGSYAIHDTITVADGKQYSWNAQADNTHLWGPATAVCYFQYDATAPGAPAVSSAAYPPQGPTTVTAGGSGTLTLTASDGGNNPSGVTSFNYNVNGTGIASGGNGQQAIAAAGGSATLTVPLSALRWGTNTVWVQTVDAAGNVSQPVHYDFYVQQSAFGAYTPGTAGDLNGDNKPDLVSIDAAGNVRIFSNPDVVSPDPYGNTGTDPLQYGGRVLLAYNQDTLWPGGTFAGALVTHGGSFSGNNTDDLVIVQNGNLAVAQNAAGNGTTWTMTTDLGKPACASCAHYNGADWSSVTQAIAVPTTPGARPDLLTVEFYDGATRLWLYTPASGAIGFTTPTLISSNSGTWQWDHMQLLGAGLVPGVGGTALFARDIGNGNIVMFPNGTSPIDVSLAAAVVYAGKGLDGSYPLVATTGRVDPNGNWPLWAVAPDGTLNVFNAHTAAGKTTWASTTGRPISQAAWGSHEVALGSSYSPPGVSAINPDAAWYSTLFGTQSYSAPALATAALAPGVTSGCAWSACALGVAPGQSLSMPNGDLFTLRPVSVGAFDAWYTKGAILPAPVDSNGTFAEHISFLGSATTVAGGTGVTMKVTYTNGHTQNIPVRFSDWTLGNGAWGVDPGNTIVATSTYRVDATGAKQTRNVYMFATTPAALLDNGQPLSATGAQIASITLPNVSGVAVFAIAVN